MDCVEVQESLIDYAHDELVGETRQEIGRHLAGCRDCALDYCRLEADLRGLAEAHDEAPRARVFYQLRRKVARDVEKPWWSRGLRILQRPIPVYGAMLVGLVPVGLWLASALVGSPRPDRVHDDRRGAPPTLTDYDGTEMPSAHREVL